MFHRYAVHVTLLIAAAGLAVFTGCAPDEPEPAPDTAEREVEAPVEPAREETEVSAPRPPHGGALVKLGDNEAHLEFLLDSDDGWLSMYMWDGEARDPVRSNAEQIGMIVTVHNDELPAEQRTFTLSLSPVESLVTGDVVGDSAHFEAQNDRFVDLEALDGVIPHLTVLGSDFQDVAFQYPPPSDDQ